MCLLQPHQQYIPTEILNEIIDKLATSHSDSKPLATLSDIALVSRSCRERVNHHRFSTLEICIHTTPFDHLENLASLLCWNSWQQEEGITRHIRSLCLWLGRAYNIVPVQSEIRDKIISNILNMVCKECGNSSSDQTPRSLSIRVSSNCHYPHTGPSNGLYEVSGLSFDTLGSEPIAALHDSCCKQFFATLRLEAIWNVPSSLFAASAIKSLHINHAHFIASEIPDHYPMLPRLVNLEVEEAPSFVPVFYRGLQNEHTAPIDKVKFWLRDDIEYGALTRIGKITTKLEVIIHECKIPSEICNQAEMLIPVSQQF